MTEFNNMDFAGAAINAFNAGRTYARQRGVENALAKYATDPAASENELIRYGAFDEADYLGKRARQKTYGEKVQAGDYRGAANAAAAGGDFDMYATFDKLDTNQQGQAAQRASDMAKIGQMLQQEIPTTGDPNAAVMARKQRLAQLLPQINQRLAVDITPEQLEQLDLSDQAINDFAKVADTLGARHVEKLQLANRGNGGYDVVNMETGEVVRSAEPYPEYRPVTIQDAAGNDAVYSYDARTGSVGGQGGGSASGFDAIYDGFIAPQEGGYTPSDGNGAPANFGINQKANPDVDVKKLTPDQARQIYKERYWAPSGADKLSGPVQAIHFDTAVNMGVGAAQQLLQQSGGDPQKYLQLREQRYRSIAEGNPDRAGALPTWLRRNQQLGQFVGGSQGSAGPAIAAPGFGSGVDPKQEKADRKGRMELRKEFDALPEVKSYNTIATAYDTIKSQAQSPSPASDIGLIFSYMRMLDPNSVVREGEFATAQNAASIPDRIRNMYNKALKGERLNPNQRQDFLRSAGQVHDEARKRYEDIVEQYNGYARDSGYEPETVLKARNNPTAQPKATAKMNDAQRSLYRQVFKPGAAYGSQDNPFIVNSDAAYNNLKSGSYFITPDGKLRGPKP